MLGVGGSAGNASHAVNDFRKICGIEAYTPTDNVSELTARVNDDGWESTFAAWLAVSKLSARDLLLVFSVGGGNRERNVSPNLVRALEYGQSVGARIAGIVGRDGGYTAQAAHACVIIPTVNPAAVTPHSEALSGGHLALLGVAPELAAKRHEVGEPEQVSVSRVFVVGGAGFIGSHLVEQLLQRSEVTVFDNLSVGKREFLAPRPGRGAPVHAGARGCVGSAGARSRDGRSRHRGSPRGKSGSPLGLWTTRASISSRHDRHLERARGHAAHGRPTARLFVLRYHVRRYGRALRRGRSGQITDLAVWREQVRLRSLDQRLRGVLRDFGLDLPLRQRGRSARHPRRRSGFPEQAEEQPGRIRGAGRRSPE